MYSAFDRWAHWSHMLTVLSMFSPCTQWVFGPLSPVRIKEKGDSQRKLMKNGGQREDTRRVLILVPMECNLLIKLDHHSSQQS